MKLIGDLCESALFPTRLRLSTFTARQLADLLHLYISAFAILRRCDVSEKWAVKYAKHTARHGVPTKWRNDATDLELLVIALTSDDIELRGSGSEVLRKKITLDEKLLIQWLRSAGSSHFDNNLTRRLFAKLDIALKVEDSSLRSIRRLAQDWDRISVTEAQLLVTRILQKLRHLGRRAEILIPLETLSDQYGLELSDVRNKEEEAVEEKPKRKSILASLTGLDISETNQYNDAVNEEATAGATASTAIAPVVGSFLPMQRRPVPSTIVSQKSKKKPK